MLVQRGNIVDLERKRVYFGEFYYDSKGIVSVLEISPEIEGELFVMPGFVDSHVHIESSMLVPSEFAKVSVRFGVVATVSDPHEIANVLGVSGMEYMRRNGLSSGFKFFFGVPSCVPAAGFDRSGFILDSEVVDKLLASGNYYYLAEMMNFPGVVSGDVEVLAKIKSALSRGLKVDGHAPCLVGDDLLRYVQSGITSDHECMSAEEAELKVKLGMKIQIREGSAAKNFDSLIDVAKKYPDMVMLCSDDCHPDDLLNEYFLKQVKRAILSGLDFFDAMKIANYNAIKHYGLPVGLLQKGDPADFIVVDNLTDLNVLKTVIDGTVVYEIGTSKCNDVAVEVVNNFYENYIGLGDISVSHEGGSEVDVKVISTIEGELYTKKEVCSLNVVGSTVLASPENDILKIVVLNRYVNAKPSVGFIKGFGLKKGAICSSVSHDSHNIVAVGVDDDSIVKVVNGVVNAKGGLAYADDDIFEILELPVAGIMSDSSAEVVASKYRHLLEVAQSSGSKMKAPFMTMAFMSLVVIPELKISDQGLFDVVAFKPTSIFENERK